MNLTVTAALIAIVIAGLFALAISFALRFRKRSFADGLGLKATDVWPQIQDTGFNFSDLLYGLSQDFSVNQIGMIVNDCRDQQAGKIVYRMAARSGWISIETPDGLFEADVLPSLRQGVALRLANDSSHILCDFTRLAGGVYRFDTKSFGILESKPPRGVSVAPVFTFTLNGTPVGVSRHIGRWIDRGCMLVLPKHLPLPIRLFVLAIQRKRN